MAPPNALITALRAEGLNPDHDRRRLAEYSYDASNYRVTPAAVLFPQTEHDVAVALRVCHRLGVPVTARGGGTSMSGNSIGSGLVVDLSRHLNRVLAVDEQARTATAEAGVVLTRLRAAVFDATDRRLTFAPDPSSQTRACLGGAIGNDACGNHSVRYGRTADHVVELRAVTADGLRITATRTGIRATIPGDAAAAARAEHLEAELRSLAADHLAAIRTELGRIPRQVSGYHLRHLLPEEGFDVARALVGSEGTCVVVTAATVALADRPARTSLIVAGYADIVDAARDVPLLLKNRPTAVEGVDEVIVATMRERRGDDAVADLPDGSAWLFIEIDETGESDGRAVALEADLRADGRAVDLRQVADPTERADLWRVREDGAGLSSRLTDPDTGETILSWPGWEDAAVRPDLLGDYLAEFRELLNRHRLTGVMYGHFGAGCMHIRIDFDLRTAQGRSVFRAFCTDAAHLVVRYEGSLSGEHGDGRARSELLPIMYSPEMLQAFDRFGDIWDPAGILAPGGLRQTRPIDVDLALADVTAEHGSQACIGVGRCRTHTGGVMCPSYRATGDEKDSTRGRARVLQEATRDGVDTVDWRAPALAESMDLCLACKACSSDCPTGVDMAAMKSEVLYHRYRGRIRPREHYTLGMLPTWLRVTPYLARPLNALTRTRVGRAGARLGGLGADRVLPEFASAASLRDQLRHAPRSINAPAPPEVVLFLDSFTRGLRPEVAGAAVRVLGGVHGSVACTADHCCGLTQITTGRLDAARKTLRRTARHLDELGGDAPIVVVEPSCAATLHDDLPRLLTVDAVGVDEAARARRVGGRVRSAAAYLGELAAQGCAPQWPGEPPEYVVVQTHCHEYATFGNRVQRAALTALGVGSVVEATGCCGVAGDFGFTAGHEAVSDAVAEQALAPALRRHPDAPVLTDGFSCATQIMRLATVDPTVRGNDGDRRRGRHLLELLDPDPLTPIRNPVTQPGGAS
ncbi:FAD-binding and (Fe-S)-binding domain-containing protein [Gordonia hydrophobica]|uniref:FAD-binding and (Fe-S)-binding domain-containing protein n=1 Tax=Gordonia hydrophobica TaxID=40516 RepID=A0ABZ2U6D3_9ACTN|nr:FAD-binding and (Fe-S)-binding domain-containing protein [Gordonia hydrophobica]MBM7365440.1 FAD/FMN-containing dehydrogenase/Fe-S oxidoreductase [Gordonia hydrophobica]